MSQRVIWIERHRRIERRQRTVPITFTLIPKHNPAIVMSQDVLWIECQRRIIRRKRTRRITYIRKRTPAINMSPDVALDRVQEARQKLLKLDRAYHRRSAHRPCHRADPALGAA